jgi:hypothetical protein
MRLDPRRTGADAARFHAIAAAGRMVHGLLSRYSLGESWHQVLVCQFESRLPFLHVHGGRDAKARWRLHRYHCLDQWHLRKNSWSAPRVRPPNHDSSGPKTSSGGPLPAERHHQKLVFPSNYTYRSGPASRTLMASTLHGHFTRQIGSPIMAAMDSSGSCLWKNSLCDHAEHLAIIPPTWEIL